VVAIIPFLNELRQKPIIAHILDELSSKLPKRLYYHVPAHTEDVMHEVLLFGIEDGLKERDLELLVVAAAFHDSGFIDSLVDNEPYGAERAKVAAKSSGDYSKEEVDEITQMILATKVHQLSNGARQLPSTDLSKYLCDADMSNLGRKDFFEKGELLQKERGVKSQQEFLRGLSELILAHKWHTPAGNKLRSKGCEENLEEIKKLLHTPPPAL